MKTVDLLLIVLIFSCQSALAAAKPDLLTIPVHTSGKILGGVEAKFGDWPWMAALLHSSEPDMFQAQFCSGVLIEDSWILTTAGCVYDRTAAQVNVAVGVFDLSTFSGNRIPVKNIRIHPQYNSNSIRNDIALLELSQPVAQPTITLFSGESKENISPSLLGKMLTAIGWGMADDAKNLYYPEKLRQVNLPVVADSFCNTIYPTPLIASQICAGYFEGKDACKGDSGGPIVIRIDDEWVHAGLVSYGTSCTDYLGWYGVYTRTSEFPSFIKSYAKNAQFTPHDNFSWPTVLPAINAAKSNQRLTCESLAGCYKGEYTDNCEGPTVRGEVDLTVGRDCTFRAFIDVAFQPSGNLISRDGSMYSGSGQTDSTGCGAFTLTCTEKNTSITCDYKYSNGREGQIIGTSNSSCR